MLGMFSNTQLLTRRMFVRQQLMSFLSPQLILLRQQQKRGLFSSLLLTPARAQSQCTSRLLQKDATTSSKPAKPNDVQIPPPGFKNPWGALQGGRPSTADKTIVFVRQVELEQKQESKIEKTIRSLIAKKIEEQDSLNYTMLNSFKDKEIVANEVPPLHKRALASTLKLCKNMTNGVWWKELWVDVKKELLHYKHGFILLWHEFRITFRLLNQVVHGHALTRREREQLVRTSTDMMRLVPLIVVIVVPFMEFALPIALKIWPNLLPSTFNSSEHKDKAALGELKVKLEMARFLQDAVSEMAVEATSKGTGTSNSVKELAEFFDTNRRHGNVKPAQILKFAKLFDDELTLDNLPAPTIKALCRLLQLPTLGTRYIVPRAL